MQIREFVGVGVKRPESTSAIRTAPSCRPKDRRTGATRPRGSALGWSSLMAALLVRPKLAVFVLRRIVNSWANCALRRSLSANVHQSICGLMIAPSARFVRIEAPRSDSYDSHPELVRRKNSGRQRFLNRRRTAKQQWVISWDRTSSSHDETYRAVACSRVLTARLRKLVCVSASPSMGPPQVEDKVRLSPMSHMYHRNWNVGIASRST